MPSISVIIPNYNHAKYLNQRIESILNQIYQDFELIIMDDCSTDNSRDVIEQYRFHPKVSSIIFNEKNSGSTFLQWKKGLQKAVGPLVWIAESDDFADKELLSTLVRPFELDKEILVSYCQSKIVDESGRFIRIMDWADDLEADRWQHDYIEEAKTEVDKYLSYRNTICNASAVLFRKPVDLNILNESCSMRMAGDWLFWRKLLSTSGKISFSSKPLNYFRQHCNTTRAATGREKEVARLSEYRRFILPKSVSPFNGNYDWIIYEWYNNRSVFKGSLDYFVPDLPLYMKIRYLVIILKFIAKRLNKFLEIRAKI